jgi:hypothetical protein
MLHGSAARADRERRRWCSDRCELRSPWARHGVDRCRPQKCGRAGGRNNRAHADFTRFLPHCLWRPWRQTRSVSVRPQPPPTRIFRGPTAPILELWRRLLRSGEIQVAERASIVSSLCDGDKTICGLSSSQGITAPSRQTNCSVPSMGRSVYPDLQRRKRAHSADSPANAPDR